jgi:16S rRNA (cytidine1402-2'-O)-methyltransferase
LRLRLALESFEFIAAEDTRTLKQLANGLSIRLKAKLFSLHEHNESERIAQLVELATDNDLLLVSDAGMPTISDPGFLLVRACAEAGVEVISLPGPSAVVTALAVSGLPTDRFCFEGFLPRKSGERQRVFQALALEKRTMVFFEAPHRILDALEDAHKVLGDRKASVSRELTKKFEHTERGNLSDLIEWARLAPKGEMVFVLEGASDVVHDIKDLGLRALELTSEGMGLKQASIQISIETGASRSVIYEQALLLKA